MKTARIIAISAAFLFVGCAKVGTRQVDKNTTTIWNLDENGKTNSVSTEVRETSTEASGITAGAGKAALRGFRAQQTGDTQGIDIDESSQETDGMAQFVKSLGVARDIGAMMYGLPPSQGVSQPAPIQPTRSPSRPPAPKGKKWILAPKDEASKPQLESEPEPD